MPPLTGSGFAGGMSGGGAGMGNAHGTITLDVSDLLRAEQISKTVGQNIEQNLGNIGKASDASRRQISSFARDVTALREAAAGSKLSSLGREIALGNVSVREAVGEYRAFRREIGLTDQQMQQTAAQARTLGGALSSGVERFQEGIRTFRTELAAIGLGAGLATTFGLNAANEIRVARIRLRQFVETEEEANALMNTLTESANMFGLELGKVLTFASTLLPAIDGNVEALDEWVVRAAKLRSILPQALKGAEVRALTEYISGNSNSLRLLFNINKEIIQDAKNNFTDMGQQLDYILSRMGATTEASLEMQDPLVGVKNELKLIAAVGFDPILFKLRELLPEVRLWLEEIRKTHPEILEIGAAFVTAAAVGAPFLLFVNQVLATLVKIKQLGLLGGLGKLGLAGLAIGGTAFGVTAGVNAFARESGPTDALGDLRHLENANFFQIMAEGIKAAGDLLLIFAAKMAPVIQAIIDGLLNFAQAVVSVYTGLGTLLTRIGQLLPEDLGGRELTQAGGAITGAGGGLSAEISRLIEENKNTTAAILDFLESERSGLANFLDRTAARLSEIFGFGGTGSAGEGTFGGAMGTGGEGGITEERQAQIAAWEQYQEQIAAVESRMQEQRLRLTEQYEQQRTRIIEQYEKQIAREAEDFARQRARANQQLQDDIEEIQSGAVEREAEWWQELADTIADLREESAGRIAEIEADAARDRERMEEQHRFNLMEAASRLDARAVASEQRRFALQVSQFEQDLQVRIAAERRNLDERIKQEQQAHQERLADARQADAERIEDLREAHAERIALEDEDRAIRLQRMKEDHQAQLIQLKDQHRQRLTELKDQARRELVELKDQFAKQNLELTRFYDKWLATQATNQAASLREWDRFWKEWYIMQQQATGGAGGTGTGGTGTGGTGGGTTPGGEQQPSRRELEQLATALAIQAGWTQEAIFEMMRMIRDFTDEVLAHWIEATFHYDVPGYARGTMNVPQTGPAVLHKGEMVIPEGIARTIRNMLGFSGTPAVAGAAFTTNNRRFSMGDIKIYQQPGQSSRDLANELVQVIRGLI